VSSSSSASGSFFLGDSFGLGAGVSFSFFGADSFLGATENVRGICNRQK